MPGFKVHITASSILGAAYGTTALTAYHVPLPACILGAGLCGVSGMLPDLDSPSGVPKRESIAFTSAVVPLLLAERLLHMKYQGEYVVLAGAAAYLFIRFVLAKLLTHFSIHRGMFHSFPACLIAGEIAFLLAGHEHPWEHYFNASAVMAGFMSHLILDEIWSIDFSGHRIKLKSSFGTAMKFWGDSMGANLLTYGILAMTTIASLGDPELAVGPSAPVANAPAVDQQQQIATQPGDGQVQ